MHLKLFFSIAFFFVFPLVADQPGKAAEIAPQKIERHSIHDTILKCLGELQNSNIEIRRNAVLVLGKYNSVEAQEALISCLQDKDAQIRLSALVSLGEGTFMPAYVKQAIVPLFVDPNVHIRRIATSMLAKLSTQQFNLRFIQRSSAKKNPADKLHSLLKKYANQALQDKDYSVRRNILAGSVYFPDFLENKNLMPFFSAEQDEVVILALQVYQRNNVPPKEKLATLATLITHKNPEIRQLAASQLIQLGKEAEPYLLKLRKDPSPNVRFVVIQALLRLGEPELLEDMNNIFSDKEISLEKRVSLVLFLRLYQEKSLPILNSLRQNEQGALRAAALRTLGMYPVENVTKEMLFKALQDEDPSVRQEAITLLLRRHYRVTETEVAQLLKSPYSDIRQQCLRIIPNTQRNLQQKALLELCIDEDQAVRMHVLQAFPSIRPEGWIDILIASLEDENPAIQKTAVLAMYSLKQPEVLEALKNYYPNCYDESLKRRLKIKLHLR